MAVSHRGSGTDRIEEPSPPPRAGLRSDDPDKHRTVEGGVDTEPFVDIAIPTEPDLESVPGW
jgi:hypothetical protein